MLISTAAISSNPPYDIVLYTRKDLLDLIRKHHNANLLIALCWYSTGFNPNEITSDRYGIAQVKLEHAQAFIPGIDPQKLLDPTICIPIASYLLDKLGLVQYAGYELAHCLIAIQGLSQWLEQHDAESLPK